MDTKRAELEFARVLLRLCQGHALALMDRGMSRVQAGAVVTAALWRALTGALEETAANDAGEFAPLLGEEGD